jgi:hypothetical protein
MPVPNPNYPNSSLILFCSADPLRIHKGDGDMWPVTWADDGNLYGGAGDNSGSPMNFWRIAGHPEPHHSWGIQLYNIDNMPIDPAVYCQREHVNPTHGVKPAGLLSLKGRLYFAVELHNYGEDPAFRRQQNVSAWIITSDDYGKSWNREATPLDFFTGRLSSPHFIQFGQDYAGARDEYVYASFPSAEDGGPNNSPSYWENGDFLLLGRVPQERILERAAWEFYAGQNDAGQPIWNADDAASKPIFSYFHMTGEDHIVYNPGLKRYLLGNYSFIDAEGNPRPYHQAWPESSRRSQLTLFEAPEPWGPWSLFYRDDNWGNLGGYQPTFTQKWMSADGKTMWMIYSGSWADYNFIAQKLLLETSE